MNLPAEVVGRRVSLRHRDGDGATDVIGRVHEVGDTIVVERRDGSLTQVAAADVIVWRVVPDRPVRTRRAGAVDVATLTRIASRGWPAIESVPLGEWELRASGGFTGRANSVAAVGDPGVPDDEAIARVSQFYAARGLPPLAQVVTGSPQESLFLDAGWSPKGGERAGALVMVADVPVAPPADPAALVTPTAPEAWLARFRRADEDPEVARAVLEGSPTVGFVSIDTASTSTGAIGRVVVTGEWAGIAAVAVDDAHQRRGYGRRIVDTALAWAVEHGADKAYLQTAPGNDAALRLYDGYGFTAHHEYRYLVSR